jgi:hypothetical protein
MAQLHQETPQAILDLGGSENDSCHISVSTSLGVVKLTFPLVQLPRHMAYSPHEPTTHNSLL